MKLIKKTATGYNPNFSDRKKQQLDQTSLAISVYPLVKPNFFKVNGYGKPLCS